MRKRLLLFVLMVSCFVVVWADEVTEKDAQQVAQQFVMSRQNRKSPPKVESAGQVSGLYVFNVSNNGGFVIVSNDDRTTPILGFGESGNIDTEKMPDNMRAWLQGYADEIAWVQKNVTKSSSTSKARTRTGSHSTATIGPLVKTTWNQGSPYNNLCPEYQSGNRSVTGCVATAMAQVMKYHEWPKNKQTEAIPGYKTSSYELVLDGLSATTFDWEHMEDTYSGSKTDAAKTAVATLMQYCGWSVKMDYGPSSGSNTVNVATALKTYFDYKSTTTYVSRSYYTYANWIDLIYYELAHNRPVVYGGESSGGGHEFVCDGYKYENETDYFHINWGWGGQSDEYFVLSSLNPYSQGIGGSSSNDGFHYGQDAVIGIQPSTRTGDMAEMSNIEPNDVNLTANSMTLSKNPIVLGETVNITLSVKNHSEKDYDGDIYVGRKLESGYYLLQGDVFTIPKGQSQDCLLSSFKPSETGTYDLVFFYPGNDGLYYTDGTVLATLSVVGSLDDICPIPTDLAATLSGNSATISWTGTASSYDVRYTEGINCSPYWLKYDNDTYIKNYGSSTEATWTWGVMYPASQITGNQLTKVAIYENNLNSGDITVNIYSGGNNAPGDLIRTETVTPSRSGFHKVTLSSPLTIDPEKNLWITLTETAQYPLVCCESTEANNQWIKNGDNWVTFGASNFGWMIRGYIETNVSWTEASTDNTSYELTGLTSNKNYVVQVRGYYSEASNYSDWATLSFTTNSPISLSESNDNSTILTNNNGQNCNITLSGRTLYKDGYWNTLCLPFNMTAAQVTAQLAPSALMTLSSSSFANGTLTLDFVNATTIEAGKPYIIKWDSGTNLTDPTLTGVTLNNTSANVATDYATFTGCFSPVTLSANDKSVLYLGADNNLYYPGTAMTINACRAYFVLPNSINAGNAISQTRTIVMNYGNDGTTSIISINNQMEEKEANELWFDLSGRRLSGKPTTKGLYINNGIKVVIK